MAERDKVRRWGPIEIVVVVFVCVFLAVVVLVGGRKSRFDAYRIACNNNLSLIGKAMLAYANDYNSEFPRSSGGGGAFLAGVLAGLIADVLKSRPPLWYY